MNVTFVFVVNIIYPIRMNVSFVFVAI